MEVWKYCYAVEILESNSRIIDVKVKLGSMNFFISFVYGDHVSVSSYRQIVWDRLVSIGSGRDGAWCMVGDLNEMLNNLEKLGGPARSEFSFYPFRNMLRDCGLTEIPSCGNRFSWGGTRTNEWIQCCLDRALGNADWFNLFPRAQSEYLERLGSDH